jgi:hypothetical protein
MSYQKLQRIFKGYSMESRTQVKRRIEKFKKKLANAEIESKWLKFYSDRAIQRRLASYYLDDRVEHLFSPYLERRNRRGSRSPDCGN